MGGTSSRARRYAAITEDAEDASQRDLKILLTKAPAERGRPRVPLKTVVLALFDAPWSAGGHGRLCCKPVGSRGAEGRGRRAKVAGAVALLARDPRELFEVGVDQAQRAVEPLRARPSGGQRPLDEIVPELNRALGADVAAFLREDRLADLEAEVRQRIERLGSAVPFPLAYNAAPSLAQLCYALCRALRPPAVLETGVAYGVTSAFIATALALNGDGELHSVDRAPLRPGVEGYIGALVPDQLRSRWTLHRGTSRRLLPRLLPEIEGLSLFVHDSQHTYRNVSWELRTVTPHLTRPAAVLVDDASGNCAFEHWVERSRPAVSAIVAEAPVGVAVLDGA
jgi:Methyltransferase domain